MSVGPPRFVVAGFLVPLVHDVQAVVDAECKHDSRSGIRGAIVDSSPENGFHFWEFASRNYMLVRIEHVIYATLRSNPKSIHVASKEYTGIF
ncbi:hypothetical protein RHRU231_450205 [Rhodococcus ruber]|uniref:Uncharacterized protein n=1 Tax=Rhodococcus ruber TaxID=1830 RepID=A0A098BK13_9NOCA|nr:hypothetical protein RHRU231_450205 [Rhodococcus ruber]